MKKKEAKAIIEAFAEKNHLVVNYEGQVGFGRECVGVMRGDNYISYNPLQYPDYKTIEYLYNKRHYEIAPVNAYHKHDCMAVLGRGKEAIVQLAEWIQRIEEIGYELTMYKTGATGLQAIVSGTMGLAIKLNK